MFYASEPVTEYRKTRLFSDAARAVFNAGQELWRYYHTVAGKGLADRVSEPYNVNASLYDIRAFFQGRKGKMNVISADSRYNDLVGALRTRLRELAVQIEPKVYEYGFLKQQDGVPFIFQWCIYPLNIRLTCKGRRRCLTGRFHRYGCYCNRR